MAEKPITAKVKLQIAAGQATPAPPVGPALGQHQVNIVEFCKQFNAATQGQTGLVIPALITIYKDRTFSFVLKSPPAAVLLKRAAGIAKGSGTDANVLVIWEADGFTPEGYDDLTSKMEAHGGDGSSHPGVSHIAAVSDDGMVFVDVWGSPEEIQRFLEEQIVPAAGGATPPGQPRFAQVHNTLAGKQTQAA